MILPIDSSIMCDFFRKQSMIITNFACKQMQRSTKQLALSISYRYLSSDVQCDQSKRKKATSIELLEATAFDTLWSIESNHRILQKNKTNRKFAANWQHDTSRVQALMNCWSKSIHHSNIALDFNTSPLLLLPMQVAWLFSAFCNLHTWPPLIPFFFCEIKAFCITSDKKATNYRCEPLCVLFQSLVKSPGTAHRLKWTLMSHTGDHGDNCR